MRLFGVFVISLFCFFGALKQPAAPVLEPMAVLWGVKGDGKKNWGKTGRRRGKMGRRPRWRINALFSRREDKIKILRDKEG